MKWGEQNNMKAFVSRIIELCHQFPHGITDQVIQNEMPHIEAQQRAVAINRLLSMVSWMQLVFAIICYDYHYILLCFM